MHKETEDVFVKENQQVIRDYLMGKFKGFEVTDTLPLRLIVYQHLRAPT